MLKLRISQKGILNKILTALSQAVVEWCIRCSASSTESNYVGIWLYNTQQTTLMWQIQHNRTDASREQGTTQPKGTTWWPGHSPKPSHLPQCETWQNADSPKRSGMHSVQKPYFITQISSLSKSTIYITTDNFYLSKILLL